MFRKEEKNEIKTERVANHKLEEIEKEDSRTRLQLEFKALVEESKRNAL